MCRLRDLLERAIGQRNCCANRLNHAHGTMRSGQWHTQSFTTRRTLKGYRAHAQMQASASGQFKGSIEESSESTSKRGADRFDLDPPSGAIIGGRGFREGSCRRYRLSPTQCICSSLSKAIWINAQELDRGSAKHPARTIEIELLLRAQTRKILVDETAHKAFCSGGGVRIAGLWRWRLWIGQNDIGGYSTGNFGCHQSVNISKEKQLGQTCWRTVRVTFATPQKKITAKEHQRRQELAAGDRMLDCRLRVQAANTDVLSALSCTPVTAECAVLLEHQGTRSMLPDGPSAVYQEQ